MGLVGTIWFIIAILIIFLILATDPKSASSNIGGENLTSLFNNQTEGRNFIRNLTWFLIAGFYLCTIVMNYIN